MPQVITGAKLFDGETLLNQHSLLIDHRKILDIIPDADVDTALPSISLNGGILAPGFIDLQVNGGGGVLFNNAPTVDTLTTMLTAHRSKGVTALLPTVVSDTLDVQQAGIDSVQSAISQSIEGIIGIHIEGPFFNSKRRGVHNEGHLRRLTQDDIDWLKKYSQLPVMITLAPEQTAPGQIKALAEAGITVCAGHTDACAGDIDRALKEGLKGFTHLFNAMRPMTGREPGVVGSALADAMSYCGIIVDGHHVHPSSILVAHNAKANGKLYLVSDAMATIGSKDKSFQLYGETIREQDGCLLNSEGKLAGSAIGMIDAVRIAHQSVGLSLEECLRMASLYPARFMQLDQQRGRIAPDYRADLVHFDDDFQVTQTWLAGDHIKHSGEQHK